MIRRWKDYFVLQRSGLFDAHYYLSTYVDVRRADVDPLMHFIRTGWLGGRNPSPTFDTNYYLDTNPDVKQSGKNPLIHYAQFGMREHRLTQVGTDISRGNISMPVRVIIATDDMWVDKDVLEIISTLS